MPSYDDDLPTEQEEILLKQLVDNVEQQQRIQALIEVREIIDEIMFFNGCFFQLKNLIIGSKRSKTAFYHVGTLEILSNLLKEYSSSLNIDILIQILDCISSFAKSNNKNLINRLIELGFIEQLLNLLTFQIDSNHFYESCLRCLRSFYLSKIYSNPYLTSIPFVLLGDQTKHETPSFSNEKFSPVDILFEHSQILEIFHRLLSISKSTQISIIEILCCACADNEKQKQIADKDFIQAIMHILEENISYNNKINLLR
jgi:hypothetical protein